MTIEEAKEKAIREKKSLVYLISWNTDKYKPEELRQKTLTQLKEIARKLNLYD